MGKTQKYDKQLIEIIAKNYLVSFLMKCGIEFAFPARDRGIDLIAYIDYGSDFKAIPLQVKAASEKSFSIDRKYKSIPGLYLVYIWNIGIGAEKEVYILSYTDAYRVAKTMAWTKTKSWIHGGKYASTNPSRDLKEKLKPYLLKPGNFYKMVSSPARISRSFWRNRRAALRQIRNLI